MNIQEAKEQIKNAVQAYRAKDEYGRPLISMERQRPLFLVGAPGIGKTAVVEQVAKEMGIGVVSYSITHHTRQSALGLPYISEYEYKGEKFRVSEYTMSEIIASIYKKMSEEGVGEGILFLDEINCTSETLTPAMLQFLQYKVFGQHRVPDGWVVVTAGNPPEYNSAVHEFDMVTQDRLKKLLIEPDYGVWRAWAAGENTHPCVLSYLDIRKEDFYRVENTIDGRSFVTPRAWIDLSDMIGIYEKQNMQVNDLLIGQYLQDERIARSFALYYELWQKYRSDYRISEILEGRAGAEILERARAARFDERVSVLSMIIDALKGEMKNVTMKRSLFLELKEILTRLKETDGPVGLLLDREISAIENRVSEKKRELLTREEETKYLSLLKYLKELPAEDQEKEVWLAGMKKTYKEDVGSLQKEASEISGRLENAFAFLAEAFGEGPELMLMMTELTSTKVTAAFISIYGSESYYKYNKELLFYERNKELQREIDELQDK